MNTERIIELELEAAYGVIDPNGSFTPEEFNNFTVKFAELIVRECIAQCESQNTIITTATGIQHWGEISDAVEQIKEHFGVEQ